MNGSIISRNLLCLLLLAAVVGCADDFQSPPTTMEPAELRISVVVTHFTEDDRRLEVFGRAELDRGLRSDGTPHPFVDDTLWIMGEPVVWSAGDSLKFSLIPPEAMIRQEVVIRAPGLAGLGPPPEIRWPLAHRTGPDTTLVEPDARPVVRLTVPAKGGMNGLSYERWWLQLPEPGTATKMGGLQVFIAASGEAAPPEKLPFPDRALPLPEIVEGEVIYRVVPISDRTPSGNYGIVPSISVALFFVYVTEAEHLPQ